MAKRLSKKVAKLEKKADGLRRKAEKKGQEFQSRTADRIEHLSGEKQRSRKKGLFAFIVAAGAAAGVLFKRKRDQELDESLWEEPKSL